MRFIQIQHPSCRRIYASQDANIILSRVREIKETASTLSRLSRNETGRIAVDVTSAMGDVMRAMKDMPPPIDLEAVQRLRAEIAQNDYPVVYETDHHTPNHSFNIAPVLSKF